MMEWNGDSTEIGEWNWVHPAVEWGMDGDSTETWNGIRFTLEWSGMELGQY